MATQNMPSFQSLRAGFMSYDYGLALQTQLLEQRRHEAGDILVLLEHPPILTLGRNASESNLLLSEQEYEQRGVSRQNVSRGGDVTFHGPGQLVGYPIVDLKAGAINVRSFLRKLEDVLLETIKVFNIIGHRVDGKTGVWVDNDKIASIGIGVKHWISWHGFALNVDVDLDYFSMINPCGLQGIKMTSMQNILGRPVAMASVEQQLIQSFKQVFNYRYAGEYEDECF